jgi:hypothetical protein
MIEVRIGVQRAPKELVLEIDEKPDEVIDKVNQAIAATDGLLWLTDSRGKQIGIPADQIAYVEVEPEGNKRVGFAAP